MADYGIKVTLPGKDITSTEPRDYAFSSQFTTLKVYSENKGTIGVPSGGTAFATISHNLGFVPMVIPYLESTADSNNWYLGAGYIVDTDVYVSYQTSVTGTANVVAAFKNFSGGSVTARYNLFIMGDDGE